MTFNYFIDGLFAVEGIYMLITGSAIGGNGNWGRKYSAVSKKNYMRLMGVISMLLAGALFVIDVPGFIPSGAAAIAALLGTVGACGIASLVGWKLILRKKGAEEAVVENGHIAYVDED